MILITELIRILQGLIISEIQNCLKLPNLKLEHDTLDQYLFLLQQLSLIGEEYQGAHYYFAYDIDQPYFDWLYNIKGKPFDAHTIAAEIEKFLKGSRVVED